MSRPTRLHSIVQDVHVNTTINKIIDIGQHFIVNKDIHLDFDSKISKLNTHQIMAMQKLQDMGYPNRQLNYRVLQSTFIPI